MYFCVCKSVTLCVWGSWERKDTAAAAVKQGQGEKVRLQYLRALDAVVFTDAGREAGKEKMRDTARGQNHDGEKTSNTLIQRYNKNGQEPCDRIKISLKLREKLLQVYLIVT